MLNEKIVLNGSYRDMGFKHGRFHRELIIKFLNHYDFLLKKGHSEQRRNLFSQMISYLKEKGLSFLIDEMKAIAEGAQIDFESILAINAFNSIANLNCTSIGFKKSNIGPIMGKNGDTTEDYRYHLLHQCKPDNGYHFLGLRFPGSVGIADSMNEHGLCSAWSSAHPKGSACNKGVSIGIALRSILEHCKTVREAITLLKDYLINGKGATVLLLDATGDAIVVEVGFGHEKNIVLSKGNVVFNTNFYASGKIESSIDKDSPYIKNASNRYKNLENLFKNEAGIIFGIEKMKEVLRNHGSPGSICQHNKGGFNSLCSFIMIACQGKMLVVDGIPCEKEYVEYTI